jgi:hypothetical protein
MLLRIRWFLIGALSAAGGAVYLAEQLRRARERMTPANLARGGARSLAAAIDAAADRISPDAQPNATSEVGPG